MWPFHLFGCCCPEFYQLFLWISQACTMKSWSFPTKNPFSNIWKSLEDQRKVWNAPDWLTGQFQLGMFPTSHGTIIATRSPDGSQVFSEDRRGLFVRMPEIRLWSYGFVLFNRDKHGIASGKRLHKTMERSTIVHGKTHELNGDCP